jgi:hypothetical protein
MPLRPGAIIVLIAVILPVLLVLVGISVDLAQMERARTELRAASDLAAKAAAGALSASGDTAAAIAAGQEVALGNRVAGTPLTLEEADFEFGRSTKQPDGQWVFSPGAQPTNAVRLRARRTDDSPNGPVELFFAGVLHRNNFQTQISSTATFLDVDICLVLDRSSSMKLSTSSTAGYLSRSDPRTCQAPWADSRWVALANAVEIFVDEIEQSPADEHLALVTFASDDYAPCGETNTEASLDQDLTVDTELISDAMDARTASIWNGNTNIDSGMILARATLTGPSARPLANKIMIVFTDGVYTGADPVPEGAAAAAMGITVHTITFSNGANQAHMQAVATAGHGQHYHAPDPAALEAIFRELAGTITILTD